MAPAADYSIVPYQPGRQALSPSSWGYARPPRPPEKRMEGLNERWPDSALKGRSVRPPRLQPTYSSRRTIEDSSPVLTGLMVDIFV